ncbi:unnamed protein product [Ixodes hexagonus]
MECEPSLPKPLDPVTTEITLIRMLDELQIRRSSVSTNRSRVEELSAKTTKLRELLYAEKQRAKDVEERAAEARIGIKLSRGSQLRPLLAAKADLDERRANLEKRLAELEDQVHKLEDQQMKLQSKVRDLKGHAVRLSNLESSHETLTRDLQTTGRAVLADFIRTSKRQQKVESEALETLHKHASHIRERAAHFTRTQRLLSENAILKDSLQTAQDQLSCLEACGESPQACEPTTTFCEAVIERLQQDLESCRCDLRELQSRLKPADVRDIGVQTSAIQDI